MVREPGSQLSNHQRSSQLRFVLYDQTAAPGGTSSRQIRSHAARSGWVVRKQKSKRPNAAPSKRPQDLETQDSLQARLEPARPTPRQSQGEGRALSRPKRNTNFLETVLIEEYPLWTSAGNSSDPFNVYPVAFNPVFRPLIEFWLSYISPSWLSQIDHGWDNDQVLAFNHLPLEQSIKTSDPAPFCAMIALAAVVLPATHPLAPNNAPRLSQILQTKAQATLATAMMDRKHATSNATIISIVMVACLTVMCGQQQACKSVYMPAFRRIVELRGGLGKIAEEEGTTAMLSRWMAWGDCVLGTMTGSPTLFSDYEDITKDTTDWINICGNVDAARLRILQDRVLPQTNG